MSADKLFSDAFAAMGFHDADMTRDRPYTGQAHTSTGIRGATEIKGITFRDLRDAFIRAYCLSMGAAHEANMPFYREADKGPAAALCQDDLYQLKGEPDPMAVCQNLGCEIEKLMGIWPNVPALKPSRHPVASDGEVEPKANTTEPKTSNLEGEG